jgi:aromatic-L-amino-acid decarboxylase
LNEPTREPGSALIDRRLELPPEEMRRLGYQVVDMLIEHFAGLRDKPATRLAAPHEVAQQISAELPERPEAFSELLKQLDEHVFAHMGLTTHPRFFAFVPSPSNFISVLGDALDSGYNAFLGNWLEAAGPSRVEQVTVGWLRELCGLPDEAGGLFVSGGSVANLMAIAVAREVKFGDTGGWGRGAKNEPRAPSLEEEDLAHCSDAAAYCSDQTHSSIQRAFRVMGLGRHQLVRMQSDEQFRLPISVLRERVAADRAAGKTPFCVVANAGTTNTGAVDPLPELAEFCRQEDLWLHVDGAYGAAAMLCDEGRRLLAGIDLADSLAIDPHKWLFQPYEIACLLVRDGHELHETFRISSEYLSVVHRKLGDLVHFQDCGLQLTRSFRALKLWLSFKYFGLEAFRAAVRRGIELAEYAEQVIRATPGFEVTTPAQLAVVTFRCVPDGASLQQVDALNETVADRMLADGFATVTTTALRGRRVLRLCTINPRTTEDDIRETIARISLSATAPH